MRLNWKKITICLADIVLAVYITLAVTSWNTPDETRYVCTKADINISDQNNSGFLDPQEIKRILEAKKVYPLGRQMKDISPRQIEDLLKISPFVKTAQCYKTKDGHVCMNITQRMPIIRIKSANGEDYYLDDMGGTLPNSKYTSDLIIATGHFSRWYARYYLTPFTQAIMSNPFWSNQIEQINVLPDKGIELVPRVGDHIIFIGYLPESKYNYIRKKEINEFVNNKLSRIEKFYKYGLSQAGWNKYSYINVEFDNQIICKKREFHAAINNNETIQ